MIEFVSSQVSPLQKHIPIKIKMQSVLIRGSKQLLFAKQEPHQICYWLSEYTVEDVEQAIPKYDARIDCDVSIKHLAKPRTSQSHAT